jgi:hypothetical protein
MNESITAFKAGVKKAIEDYEDLIRALGKKISVPRANDTIALNTILKIAYDLPEECIGAVKAHLKQMKTKWWFQKSRLKLSVSKVVEQFENPFVVEQILENSRLQTRLSEVISENVELKKQPASAPVPVPVVAPSINNDATEGVDWNMQVGSTPASHTSLPNFRDISQTPESFGSAQGRVFARVK